ncbi:MAG: DnaJ domain-containing protein [Thermodesulfobacteriota bacterium]|jgi:DnaJ-class molecular chaperone|nr:DnaJ domain-containing protein [Thermodesulfobacteriota bacterium]
MQYEELEQALDVFALTDRTTLQEIKKRHKNLVRRHHPDAGEQPDAEKMKMINAAYRVLMQYCEKYRFSFSREEFYRQNPEARLRDQFGEDFMWGKEK